MARNVGIWIDHQKALVVTILEAVGSTPIMKSLERTGPLRRVLVFIGTLALAISGNSCSRDQEGITASGTIEVTEIRLSPKVGGEVIELIAREGDAVEKGQILARIDHTALDLQLEQAKAEMRLAEAQFALLVKGARSEDIQQGQEALVQAEENLRVAREDAERTRQLLPGGSVSEKQRDEAEARLVVAQAQANAAEQALKKLQNLARPEEVQAAEARVDQARFAVQLLQNRIQDATVTSPLNGIVLQRLAEVGENIVSGATMFVVADLSGVELEVYVAEPDLSRLDLGQQVEVQIDGDPPATFPGKITFIASEAEFTPKNIQTRDERVKLVFGVKVFVENPLGILKPGMPADAVLVP
jgi:HlyD family secretion protein